MVLSMAGGEEPVQAERPERTPPRSSLGLIVLWELFGGPKHVYGIQKRLEQEGKDRVVNVRSRANLYQTLERLLRLGLVDVQETVRHEGYPDRIVYAITEAGREAARAWLREMLHSPSGDYPEFIAALSILFGLAPEDARAQLERRAERLAAELAETESLIEAVPDLPRLFLLEEEYRRAVLGAELAWLSGVIADLHDGQLTWSEQWLLEVFAAFHPPEESSEEN
jgi:DNA-binding PadR family transcriptional regulator